MSDTSELLNTNTTNQDKKNDSPTILYLVEDIEEATVIDFVDILHRTKTSERPVYIYINSHGGDTTTSLSLYYLVKNIPTRTVGINIGKVYSGALMPFMACDYRIALPHSSFMFHDMRSFYNDYTRAADFAGFADFISKLSNVWRQALVDVVGNKELVDKWLFQETYLFAEEALRYGIIDEIKTEVV